MNVILSFVQIVKTECVLNQHYFSFYDIPDLIIKKKYQRKEYELILKILNKVKKEYLVQKAQIVTDKPVAELEVTDEDLVPLDIFDLIISQKEHKFDDRKSY